MPAPTTAARKSRRLQQRWDMTVPVLSTSHITLATLALLRDTAHTPVSTAPYAEGVFVGVGDDETGNDMPADLKAVAKWLWREYRGQGWIRFDRDGDIIEGLPRHVWD